MAASLHREDPAAQDIGTTLIAVLGTPAIIAFAHGVATWIKRRGQAIEIELDGKKLTLRATGAIDDNASKLIEALSRRKP